MDRRNFLRSMFALAGATVASTVLVSKEAQAASVLDQLKAMESDADKPAADAVEVQGGGGRGGFGGGRGGFGGGYGRGGGQFIYRGGGGSRWRRRFDGYDWRWVNICRPRYY